MQKIRNITIQFLILFLHTVRCMDKHQSTRISFVRKATLARRLNQVIILRKIFGIISYYFSIRYHPLMFNNIENKTY
jgi:hypothetical protein